MDTTGYIALSRQIALERHMTTIANNIANANTSGYRAEHAFSSPSSSRPASRGRSRSSRTSASTAT